MLRPVCGRIRRAAPRLISFLRAPASCCWQIQCKNTARVALDDVAKEVGLTHFLKSNVIVIVTTGDISGEARRYANKIMADSNLAVVMLDGGDLQAISESPATIVRAFEREARHAMNLKKLDI